jgi:hypothetical protein
MSSKKK